MEKNKQRLMVAGNWKMNGSRASITALLKAIAPAVINDASVEIVVFPPFIFLDQVATQIMNSTLSLGAQNLSTELAGAYTGEIAASMLKEVGCTYVLIGHSERRQLFHETDDEIAKKWAIAKATGLTPILCVGETQAERDAGKTEHVITRQLSAIFDIKSDFNEALVAYEPIWAIGTGLTATPEQAQTVHAQIRAYIAARDPHAAAELRILYGGSVKSDNAEALFAMPDVNGGLVGGASLDADAFIHICRAAAEKR